MKLTKKQHLEDKARIRKILRKLDFRLKWPNLIDVYICNPRVDSSRLYFSTSSEQTMLFSKTSSDITGTGWENDKRSTRTTKTFRKERY